MERIENFINNLKQVELFGVNWSKFLDWDYLTDPRPSKFFVYEQWIYVVVLINIIIAVVVFRYVSRYFSNNVPKYRLVKRLAVVWFTNTIVLLLYNIFRSEGLALFSMRLLLLIVLLSYVATVVYGLVYWIIFLPRRLARFEKAQTRERYIRKKKK